MCTPSDPQNWLFCCSLQAALPAIAAMVSPWVLPYPSVRTQTCPTHLCEQTQRPSGHQAENGTVHSQYLAAFRTEPG